MTGTTVCDECGRILFRRNMFEWVQADKTYTVNLVTCRHCDTMVRVERNGWRLATKAIASRVLYAASALALAAIAARFIVDRGVTRLDELFVGAVFAVLSGDYALKALGRRPH